MRFDPLPLGAAVTMLCVSVAAQFGLTQFPHVTLPQVASDTYGIAVGDVDGDGRKDIVTANGTNTQQGNLNQLYLADGKGGYQLATQGRLPALGLFTLCVELADIDGDGDLDIFFGNGGSDSLLLNDGTGHFTDVTATQLPTLVRETWDATFVDVDGDKDLDLFCAGTGKGTLALLINDGKGSFTDQTPIALQISSISVSCCDYDRDGDSDLLVTVPQTPTHGRYHLPASSELFRHDGSAWTPIWGAGAWAGCLVEFADLDRDTWPDLMGVSQRAAYLLHGSASGFNSSGLPFDLTGILTSEHEIRDLAVGDFDEDGDDDCLVTYEVRRGLSTYAYFSPTYAFENHDGVFLTLAGVQSSQSPTFALRQNNRVADVDDDGDLDLLWALGRPWDPTRAGEPNQLALNTRRQITTPWAAEIGKPFVFDYHASNQKPGQPVFVLPFLGARLLPKAMPIFDLGLLHLDPTALTLLYAAGIPASGRLSLIVVLPNDPGLRGIDILVQAIYFEGNTLQDLGLSAAAGATIR